MRKDAVYRSAATYYNGSDEYTQDDGFFSRLNEFPERYAQIGVLKRCHQLTGTSTVLTGRNAPQEETL